MRALHLILGLTAYIILLVDMVNGFFLNQGMHLPISQSIKLLLTMMLVIGLFNYSQTKAIIWLMLSITMIVFPTLPNLIQGDSSYFLKNLIHSQKFFFSILVYFYFSEYFSRDHNLSISKILLVNIILILINILLTYIGYGYSAYQVGAGATGYFYSANELGYTALVIFSFALYYSSKKSSWIFYSTSFITFIMSVLIGMKVCIIGITIISVFLFLQQKGKIRKVVFSIFIISLLFGVYLYLGEVISPLIERWEYMYSRSDGIIEFFLSGRKQFLIQEGSNYFYSSMYNLFFGLGEEQTVEMDFFDVLFNYGFYGVIIIYGYYLYLIANTVKVQLSRVKLFTVLLIGLILLASLVSGHFVFSAMAGFFLSFFVAYIQKRYNYLI